MLQRCDEAESTEVDWGDVTDGLRTPITERGAAGTSMTTAHENVFLLDLNRAADLLRPVHDAQAGRARGKGT
jgi:hypothetical protein